MGACNVKSSPVVSVVPPALLDCMASSPEGSVGVPALVDCMVSSRDVSIGPPSHPGRMSTSPDVSVGLPSHLGPMVSRPDVSIGLPSHLCREVSKGVPAHLDFLDSSPDVSIGVPAHVDQRHSALESGGSSNESHSYPREHTPNCVHTPGAFSSEERSRAPTSVVVANADRPTVPPPPLGARSDTEVLTSTLGVTNRAQLDHAEMAEMVTQGQDPSMEVGRQLKTARLSTAQWRNGYVLSPVAVRRQESLGALEEKSMAGAAQPETARSAVGDPATRAYFADMPQQPPEQSPDNVPAPRDLLDSCGRPVDGGKRELGLCLPSGGALGQGDHQVSPSEQACQKTGGGMGMLLRDGGTIPASAGLGNLSGADCRCSGGSRVITGSRGQFTDSVKPPECRSLKGEATPLGVLLKPELCVSTPIETDTSAYVAKDFPLTDWGPLQAPDNIPACSHIKWDTHGGKGFGRGRGHEAPGIGAEFLAQSGVGGMQWDRVGNNLANLVAGEGSSAGIGKGVANDGGMGKAWQDINQDGERQADGTRNRFMIERVKQDIVTQGHCGVRNGAPHPPREDQLPVSPLSTAAANARGVAPMSLYPVDVAKGEIAPGEAGFPPQVHEPVWARAARVAAEVLNGPKSRDKVTAEAEARAAQQLWWAAVRCAAGAISPHGSPEPFTGGQTQGLLDTYSYPSSAPRSLGGLGHISPPRHALTPVGYVPPAVAPSRPAAIPLGYGPPADVAPKPALTPLGYGQPAGMYSGHGGIPAGRGMTAGFKEAGVPPWVANRADAHRAWTSGGYNVHMTGYKAPPAPHRRSATPVPGIAASPTGSTWTADDAAAVLVGLPDQQGFWEEKPLGVQRRRSPMPRRGTPQGHVLPRHPAPSSDMPAHLLAYAHRPASVPGTAYGPRNPNHPWVGKTSRVADEGPVTVITLSSTPGGGAASEEDGPEEMGPPPAATPVLEAAEQLDSDSGSGEDAGERGAHQEMESRRVSSPWHRAEDAAERGGHQEIESRRVPLPWRPVAPTSGAAAPCASLRKHARKRSKPERAAEAAEPQWYEQHSAVHVPMHVPEVGVMESVGPVKPSAHSEPQGNPGRGQQSLRGRRRRGSTARTHIGQRRGRGRGAARGRGRGQKCAASTGTWDPLDGVTSGAVAAPRHSARLQENGVSSRFATRKRRSLTRSPSPTGSGTISVAPHSITPPPRAQAATRAGIGFSTRTTVRQTGHMAASTAGPLRGGVRRGPGRPRSITPVSAGHAPRGGARAQPYTHPCHGFLPKIKTEDPSWGEPGMLEVTDLGGYGGAPVNASGAGLEGCGDAPLPLRVKGLRTPRKRPVPTLPQKRDSTGRELRPVVQKAETADDIRSGTTRPTTGDVKGLSKGLVIAPLVQTSSAMPVLPALGSAGREGPVDPVAETYQRAAPLPPALRRPENRGPKLDTHLKAAQKRVGSGRTPPPKVQASPSMFIHRITKNLRQPKRRMPPFTLTSLRMLIGALGYYMSSRYHSLAAAGAVPATLTSRNPNPTTAWELPVLLGHGRARLIRHSVMAYCLKVGTPHAIAAFVTGALTAARIALIMRVVPMDWQQHAACAPSVLPLAIQQVLRIPAAAAAAISAVVFAREGEGRQPTPTAPPGSPLKRRRLSAPPVSNHPSAKRSLPPVGPDGTVQPSASLPRAPDLLTARPLQTGTPLNGTATAGGGPGPTVPAWRPHGGATPENTPVATLQVKPLQGGQGGEQELGNPAAQEAQARKPCPPLWKGASRG